MKTSTNVLLTLFPGVVAFQPYARQTYHVPGRGRLSPAKHSVWRLQSTIQGTITRRDQKKIPKRRNDLEFRDGPLNSSTISSGQIQLPWHIRIAKGMWEECVPWMATFFVGLFATLAFHHSAPFFLLFLAEFLFCMLSTKKVLQKLNKPMLPEPLINKDWEEVAFKVWASLDDALSRKSYLMGWFYEAPFTALRQEDALSYLSWQRYGMPLGTGLATEEEISDLLKFDLPLLEQNVNGGRPLPQRNPDEDPLPFMAFNCEPLRYRHKPMLFYAATHGMSYATHQSLTKIGFEYVPAKDPEHDLSYWSHIPNTSVDNMTDPLVFIHGVGGIASCYPMIEDLLQSTSDDNTPIIVIDLPHVSLRWCKDNTPKIRSQVASISKILDSVSVGSGKATFVGHSYGTALISWMVQSHPEKVKGCVFIDPICFMLHLKKILFNFHLQRVDEKIQSTRKWDNPFSIGSLINLAGTEMHTNYSMLRQFSWATNSLWPEDLVNRNIPTSIIMSEVDDIVPVQDVEQLFQRADSALIDVHVFDNANHGDMLFDEEMRAVTVEIIRGIARTSHSRRERILESLL
uniref:AB hydrolase-1 domain-containing protein n=1 Tax=Chaetoceros debilis TaxID=122233 RepID=A0A7S3V438_9STRA